MTVNKDHDLMEWKEGIKKKALNEFRKKKRSNRRVLKHKKKRARENKSVHKLF